MTDWDERWRTGKTPWDKGAPAPPLIELLSSDHGEKLKNLRVLVPGCGSGEDVRELARWGAKATGLDLSPAAIEHARAKDPTPGAQFVSGSFFDWVSEPFDAIWEHTCFCAIDPTRRSDYVNAVHQLLKPGGKLLAVFYLSPKQREDGGAGPPFGCSIEELDALFDGRFVLEESRVPEVAFPGREGRELLRVFRRNPE